MEPEQETKRTMRVNEGACMGCGYCEDVCPTGAVHVSDVARIDPAVCIGCGCCAGRCPMAAIDG